MFDLLMDFFKLLELLTVVVVVALFVYIFRKRKEKKD
ncbi:hypothetical protein BMS3Bbin06_02113 [bacterium BMS3Bbin06]|nr:hypothetical protein BMS3Bbin06_02113 [bacterium BMS3Bbin06]